MQKIDLKKEFKNLYSASAKEAVLVDVPPMKFLMIDGSGDPNNSPEFQAAIETLYSVAYTLKFMVKKGKDQVDYGVMPLQGLWWCDNMEEFSVEEKGKWKWTLMIMQPDFITREMVDKAAAEVKKKKNPPALSKLRFEEFHEGESCQILHIGPYSEEKPTIEKLHRFAKEKGYELSGKHHEIYLGDPRKSAPEKLKTILRNPISPSKKPS